MTKKQCMMKHKNHFDTANHQFTREEYFEHKEKIFKKKREERIFEKFLNVLVYF